MTVTHGRVVALRDADLTLRSGAVTALMGRNGSGKSSLLWTLQGTGKRRSGDVRFVEDGAEPRPRAARRRPTAAAGSGWSRRRRRTCSTWSRSTRSAWPRTPGARPPRGPAGTCSTGWCPGIAGATHPRDLSEGQRLALALAVVLTARPRVVMLDEPTRGLDYPAKAHLAGLLRGLAGAGHAVVVATHDVEFVAQVADDVVVLADGEVVSSGPVRRVVAESPAFAPQVTKILGPPWLRVDEVVGVGSTP